ncbi:MAG: outer membrane beta-barrel protein, partial [Prevotella sp.]|nr:outer membrane beta-barrel protein [Prevotella sp.]
MKKAMIIAAMMTVAAAANAQKNDVGQFSIQPRIGFSATYVTNASDMPFDDEGTTAKGEMNGGGVIGAEAEYQLTERVSVAGGANYSMQGCNWK